MIDLESLNNPFDPNSLMERVDSDREMFKHLLNLFKTNYPAHREAIYQALKENQFKNLQLESHSIWGELVILGHQPAIDLVLYLEQTGREKTSIPADTWIENLDKSVKPILLFIQTLLQ